MTDRRQPRSDPAAAQMEERLRSLEAALDLAIERLRTAKNAAKQAKDEAKLAKKDKKRARKALIRAQEEYGIRSATADQDKPVLGGRIAESPERRRAPKKKTSARAKRARIAKDQGERAGDTSVEAPSPNDATTGPSNAEDN